jgi:DNA repair exonuclease SbcCD ATPase subunit
MSATTSNLYVGNCVKLTDKWHDYLLKNISYPYSVQKYSNEYIVVYREIEIVPGNPYITSITGKVTILYNIEHSLEILNRGGSKENLKMLYCRVEGISEIIENPTGQENSGYCTSKLTHDEIYIIILKYAVGNEYLVLPYVHMVDPPFRPERGDNFSSNFIQIDSYLIGTIKQCQIWSLNYMLSMGGNMALAAAEVKKRESVSDLKSFYPFIVGNTKYPSSRVERTDSGAASGSAASGSAASGAASGAAASGTASGSAASGAPPRPASGAPPPPPSAATVKLEEDLEEAKKTINEANDRIRQLAEEIARLSKQINENTTKSDEEKIADLERERVRVEAERKLAEARKAAEAKKAAALERLQKANKVEAAKRDAEFEKKMKLLREEAERARKAAEKAAEDEKIARDKRREDEARERERVRIEEEKARKLEAELREKKRRREIYVRERDTIQKDIDEIEGQIGKVQAREAEIQAEKETIRREKEDVKQNIEGKFAQLQITQIDIDTLLDYDGEDRGDVIKFKGNRIPVGENIILYNNGNRRFIRKDFDVAKDTEYKNEKGIYEVLSKTPSSFEYVPYYFGSKDTAGGGGRLLLEYIAGITSDKLLTRNITDAELGVVKQGLKKALTVFKDIHLLHLTLNPKNILIQMDKNTIKGVLLKNFEYSMILNADSVEGPVTIPRSVIIRSKGYYPDDFKDALSTQVNYTYECLPIGEEGDLDNFAFDKLSEFYKTCSKKTRAGVAIPPVIDFFDEDSRERIYTIVPRVQELGAKNKSFEEEEKQLRKEKEKQELKLKRPRGNMENLRREFANVITPVASATGRSAASPFVPGDCVKIVSVPAGRPPPPPPPPPPAEAKAEAEAKAKAEAEAKAKAAEAEAEAKAAEAEAKAKAEVEAKAKAEVEAKAAEAKAAEAEAKAKAEVEAKAAEAEAKAKAEAEAASADPLPSSRPSRSFAYSSEAEAKAATEKADAAAKSGTIPNLIDAIKAQGKDKVIECLSVHKQDVDSTDISGKRAIDYAIESMNEDIIDILHEYLVQTDDIEKSIAAQLKQAETEKEKIETSIQQQKDTIELFEKEKQEKYYEKQRILNPGIFNRGIFNQVRSIFTKPELSQTNSEKIRVIDERIKYLEGRIKYVNETIKGAEAIGEKEKRVGLEEKLKAKENEIDILEKKSNFIYPPPNPRPERDVRKGACIHLYGGSNTAFYQVTGVKNTKNYSTIRRMEGTVAIGPEISVNTSRFVSTTCPTASGGDNTIYVIVSTTATESVIKNFDGTGPARTVQNTELVKIPCPAPSSKASASKVPASKVPASKVPASKVPASKVPAGPKFKLGDCVTLAAAFESTTEIDLKTKVFLKKITPMVTGIDIITGSTVNSNYIEYELTKNKKGEREDNTIRIQEKYLSSAACPKDFLPYKAPPPPEAADSEPVRRQPPAGAPVNELARDKDELKKAITEGFRQSIEPISIEQRISERIRKILENGSFKPDPSQFTHNEPNEPDERTVYENYVRRLKESADKVKEYIDIMNEQQINLIYLLSEDEKKRIVIPRQKLNPKDPDDQKLIDALRILKLNENSTEKEYIKAYRIFVVAKHPNKGGNSVTFNKVSGVKDKLDEFFKKATSGGSRYGRTRSSRSKRRSETRKYKKRI